MCCIILFFFSFRDFSLLCIVVLSDDLVFGDGVIDIDGGLAELGLGAHIQG